MKKLIDFKSLTKEIQTYADEHFEGNFSLAVRSLISKWLALVKARTELYKQDLARVNDEYHEDINNLEGEK